MKKLIYLTALALIAAGGIFWSCQKDETMNNPENGLMLKSADNCDECVTNWIDSKETQLIADNLYVDTWNDDANAYFKVYRLDGATIGNITFDGGSNIGFSPAVTEYLITKPVTVDACTKVSTLFDKIGGLGGAGGKLENINVDYYLRELCPQECEESFSYVDNGNGILKFTYIPAVTMTDVNVVFTFPQVQTITFLSGEEYDSFEQPGNGNAQNMQATLSFVACNEYTWTVQLVDCTAANATANGWTDFTVDGISKKNAETPNFTYTCP